MLCEFLQTFTKALYNGDWSTAELAATEIAAIDKSESCLRLAELYLAKGDYVPAVVCLDQIIGDSTQKESDSIAVHLRIRAMILLAEVHCASVTMNNVPTCIITVLNSALSLANLFHQDFYASMIQLHLANVQLLMGMPSQALKILDKVLVKVLAHGGVYDRARAMLLFVKCLVADAGSNPSVDRHEAIKIGAELLMSIKEDFVKVEAYSRVCDVLYLMVIIDLYFNFKLVDNF